MALVYDSDLKSVISYSEGQKEAAHRVLVEFMIFYFNNSINFKAAGVNVFLDK